MQYRVYDWEGIYRGTYELTLEQCAFMTSCEFLLIAVEDCHV